MKHRKSDISTLDFDAYDEASAEVTTQGGVGATVIRLGEARESHAELLEAKVADDMSRARAAQIVASALDAMSTAKEIHQETSASPTRSDLTKP